MKKLHNQHLFKAVAFTLLVAIGGCKKTTENHSNPSQLPPLIKSDLSTNGIGGYDLAGFYDQILAYGTHLICYRPVNGFFWDLYHNTPPFISTFGPDYRSTGVAGYNLASYLDRIITFDYDHSGNMNYIVPYRPSAGIIYIIRNNSTLSNPTVSFTSIVQDHNGIGGYDLRGVTDKVAAFDYEHSGKMDYLVLSRDGYGFVWILKNTNGTFSPVYQSSTGIGGDNFLTPYTTTQDENDKDMLFAFDYSHSGLKDYLLHCTTTNVQGTPVSTYTSSINIIGNNNGVFTTKAHLQYAGQGAGTAWANITTRCIAFDYEHSGKADYLVVYQPSTQGSTQGIQQVYILKNNNDGTFATVYQSNQGIGGWTLNNVDDRMIAYDFSGTGKLDYLLIYRPGTGLCAIIQNTNGVFTQIF